MGEVESNFDPIITTVNDSGTGSLVMYRDSFGNALLPFLADSFTNAYFSRGVPYRLIDLDEHDADVVIVERAERFLPDMAENPPVMQAPEVEKEGKTVVNAAEDAISNLTVEEAGDYWKITGLVEKTYLENKAEIYLHFPDGKTYEAFPATFVWNSSRCDNGFVAYMEKTRMSERNVPFDVFVRTSDGWINCYNKGEIKG